MAISTKYTQEEARSRIKSRYENMDGKIPFTIKRLDKDPAFKKVFAKLKNMGYADWVIYMAIINLVMNYRAQAAPQNSSMDEMIERSRKILDSIEKEADLAVPLTQFTEDKLELAIDLGTMSSLKGFGYSFRKRRPNVPAIRKFMAERYNYFSEDQPHKKWFSFENN